MDSHSYQHSGYLEEFIVLKNLKKTVKHTVAFLKKLESEKNITFDSIAFRGNSGTLISVPVAMALSKELIMVRKGDLDECHSSHRVEGHLSVQSYIILDDIMSSGLTAAYIHHDIKEFAPKAVCVGLVTCGNLDKNLHYGNLRTSWLEPKNLNRMYKRIETIRADEKRHKSLVEKIILQENESKNEIVKASLFKASIESAAANLAIAERASPDWAEFKTGYSLPIMNQSVRVAKKGSTT